MFLINVLNGTLGGDYIPLRNAAHVLTTIIQRALLEEDTLSQLLRHFDIHLDIEYGALYCYSYVQKRADFMIEYCQTMTDIRKNLYTYRCEPIGYVIDKINDDINTVDSDNFEPYSPSSSVRDDFNRLLCDNINIIASTPITDDEGYRTRLPTTASAESSFIHVIGSPAYSNLTDFDWTNEIDDECF